MSEGARPGRPEWVGAVNRGEVWPMADVAAAPFTLDRLAGEAASRLGVEPRDVTAVSYTHLTLPTTERV